MVFIAPELKVDDKWLIHDEIGLEIGMKDDAPEEIKEKYKAYSVAFENALKSMYAPDDS